MTATTGIAHAQDNDNDELLLPERDEERLRQLLATPIHGNDPQDVARLYLERIKAARQLQDGERELAEIRAALDAVGVSKPDAYWLLDRLAEYHVDRGDYVAGLEARWQAVAVAPSQGRELIELDLIAGLQTGLRDRAGAERTLERAQELLLGLRSTSAWRRRGGIWEASHSLAIGRYQRMFGSYAYAEAAYRACISSIRTHLAKGPSAADGGSVFLTDCSTSLTLLLLSTGRLEEAAILSAEVRALAREFAEKQSRPAFEARLTTTLARVEIERNHLDNARAMIDQSISRMRKLGVREGSLHLATLRYLLASIEMLAGNWTRAEEVFSERQRGLKANREQARQVGVLSPDWAYTLLRMGQTDRALDMLRQIVRGRRERFGEESFPVWEARGFQALALAAAGKTESALSEFRIAVPRIIEFIHGERASVESGVLRSTRLNWILEGYIALLSEIAARQAGPADLDPVDEAFRLADLVRGSSVQRALNNASSRAVIHDQHLAELARQYHDRQRELGSLSDSLGNLLSPGGASPAEKVMAGLRADLGALRRDQQRLYREIERRFPGYAGLLEPKPPGILEVQRSLRPGEALVSILVGQAQTYVWAVPQSGRPSFVRTSLNAVQVARHVQELRRRLDLSGLTDASRIPPFDFVTSHALYTQMLEPVEPVLRGASSLIIVPHAELSGLPFAVLTTAPFSPPRTGTNEFEGYVDAPWLLKRHAISQLPSTTALLSLRRDFDAQDRQLPFVGFANPVFSADATPVAVGRGSAVRSPPLAPSAPKDESKSWVSQLHLLQALPETADEVREIGKILGAEEDRDLFLRERATVSNVKSVDLSRYRVVMFATHGLVPGDLPGLSQPALALSNPALTGSRDHGLLLMEDVLGLSLRADWVVLSACNTAAAANSEEAISGLGRAFFFAGARSLLVTQWPIETESAQALTTSLFRSQAQRLDLPRDKALREASLAVMRSSSQAAPRRSYAHPAFWAPFVLVGERDRMQ